MALLTARLMGPPSLLAADGALVPIPSAKAAGLLWYLIANRQVHARDRLAGMLWPDVPDRRAQASLRTALYELRGALGADAASVLFVDRTRLGIHPSAGIDTDISAIERVAATSGESPDAVQVLEEAVAAYTGPFLDGIHFAGAFDLEDWLFLERERLANLYASALCRLAEWHGAANNLARAIELCRCMLVLDPLREDVHRALMRHLARAGQRNAALAQYATCRDLLRSELGVEPLAATTELFDQIRDGLTLAEERPAPGPLSRAAALVSGAPTVLRIQRPPGAPMVGRASEMGALADDWRLTELGGGSLVAIEGEAGVGKSRLVDEFIAGVGTDAFVLRGYCHETTVAEPYGPLIEAVRSAVSTLDLDDLDLAPVWAREMARLVPDLEPWISSEAPSRLDGVRDRERLFQGVRAFLAALSARRPTLLVVEDVHWSDETTLNLVHYVSRRPCVGRLLVIVTCRGDELDSARKRLVRRLANAGRAMILRDLSGEETSELVAAMADARQVPERFGTVLHRATGGNPFFIIETLRAMFEQGSLSVDEEGWSTAASSADEGYAALPVPESVALIVASRLDRLGDDPRHLLECAAVLRRDFDFDQAAAVSRLSAADALDALDDLLEAGLLCELPAAPGALSASYDFTHALVRDYVYQGLSGARRQYLHRQIAGLLEAAVPVQADRVAYHYLRGGVRDRACLWSLRAGETALGLYAGESALVHFRTALELAVSPSEELAALSGLGDAFVGLSRHGEAVRSFLAAIKNVDDALTRADLHRRIGRAHERQGAYDKALVAFHEARQALQGQPLSLTSIRIADSLATVYVRLGRHAEAIELCHDALRWLAQHGDLAGAKEAEAWLGNTLGVALMHAGEFDAALESLDRSLALKRELGDRQGEATLLNNLGVVHYHRGDDEAAQEHYQASLAIKTAIGDTYGRAIAITNLALIETHLGRYDSAGTLLEEAQRAAHDSGAAWLEPEIARVAAQRHLAMGDIDAAMERATAALLAAEALGVPSFIGVAHRVLGLVKASAGPLAREADEHFMTSLAVFEMLQNDHELAKTHAAYGEALLSLGRTEDAAIHIRAAAEVFARSGATGRLQRLDPLLGG